MFVLKCISSTTKLRTHYLSLEISSLVADFQRQELEDEAPDLPVRAEVAEPRCFYEVVEVSPKVVLFIELLYKSLDRKRATFKSDEKGTLSACFLVRT